MAPLGAPPDTDSWSMKGVSSATCGTLKFPRVQIGSWVGKHRMLMSTSGIAASEAGESERITNGVLNKRSAVPKTHLCRSKAFDSSNMIHIDGCLNC